MTDWCGRPRPEYPAGDPELTPYSPPCPLATKGALRKTRTSDSPESLQRMSHSVAGSHAISMGHPVFSRWLGVNIGARECRRRRERVSLWRFPLPERTDMRVARDSALAEIPLIEIRNFLRLYPRGSSISAESIAEHFGAAETRSELILKEIGMAKCRRSPPAGTCLHGPVVTQESLVVPSATGLAASQTATSGLCRVIRRHNHRFHGNGPASSRCDANITKRVPPPGQTSTCVSSCDPQRPELP